MRRRTVRPFGQSTTTMRLVSMVMALAVVWALYRQVKDPTMWRILFDHPESPAAVESTAPEAEPQDPVAISPIVDDRDETEAAEARKLLQLAVDRTPLKTREMSAYWKLMEWSRSQPFNEFRRRALADVPFTQLWEQPEKYRGKPIRLRLHVRRILEYNAPENPLEVEKSYEAWGWTDESRSFPYVVVFTDPPSGLPIGTDVRAEIEFVGYFLKVMTYTAFDNARGAPLLIGTARLTSIPKSTPTPARLDWTTVATVVVACLAILGYVFVSKRRTRTETRQASGLPNEWTAPDPDEELEINQTDEDAMVDVISGSTEVASEPGDLPRDKV